MPDLTQADFKSATDLADKMQSPDNGDARGVGSKGYPAVGDTKVVNGEIARFDGRMWLLPSGKPAW